MGQMKLRKRDLDFARSRRFLSIALDKQIDARTLLAWYAEQFQARGYSLLQKTGPRDWAVKRRTVTMRRVVFLGAGWPGMSTRAKAALLAHEYAHARQWAEISLFVLRYALSPRFRFAVECHGYREQARALRAMGVDEAAVQSFAAGVPAKFVAGYAIGSPWLRDDVRDTMADIVAAP